MTRRPRLSRTSSYALQLAVTLVAMLAVGTVVGFSLHAFARLAGMWFGDN